MTANNIEKKFIGEYDYDMNIITKTMEAFKVLYLNFVITDEEFEKVYSEITAIKQRYMNKEGL